MKRGLTAFLILSVSAFTNYTCENSDEKLHAENDSLCSDARIIAIEEFYGGDFLIRELLLENNADYAEEIFFQRYKLKPSVWHSYNQTPCVQPPGGFPRNRICYRQTIDSLLILKCGPNVYERIKKSADSLKELYPDRYSREYVTWRPRFIEGDDSLKAKANRGVVYPPRAVRDSITGSVRVLLHIDTSGQIDGASVLWGIRRDVDSSALASCLKLGRFYPAFRWGCPQASEIAVDVDYTLAE